MPTKRVRFLGVDFDRLSRADVLAQLRQVTPSSPYRYLVTPNVDHVVHLNSPDQQELIPVYRDADTSVCDSRILRLLARMHRIDLPLVPGSDLTVDVLGEIVNPGDRIAVIGGSAVTISELFRRYPGVTFEHFNPPMGLRHDLEARRRTAAIVANLGARFTLFAVGSPQQELIAAEVRKFPHSRGTALCIGASLDFITGQQRRAPRWMQTMHLEWAFRLLSEPRRMWRRYLVEGPRIFVLAARHRNVGNAAQ